MPQLLRQRVPSRVPVLEEGEEGVDGRFGDLCRLSFLLLFLLGLRVAGRESALQVVLDGDGGGADGVGGPVVDEVGDARLEGLGADELEIFVSCCFFFFHGLRSLIERGIGLTGGLDMVDILVGLYGLFEGGVLLV